MTFKSARQFADLNDDLLEEMSPTNRAIAIAEALLDYGHADEGPGGWSGDINIPDKVKWWSGKVAGPEYLADEDDAFVREVLLADLDVDYEKYGPDDQGDCLRKGKI